LKAQESIAVAATVLMLSACSAPPPKPMPIPAPRVVAQANLDLSDTQAVADAFSVQRDEHNIATHYVGPNIAEKYPDQLFIRASKSDIGRITYKIHVKINYGGPWRFYNEVKDSKGNILELGVMTRQLDQCQRNDCKHSERLEVDVTQKYLEENLQSGLRFRVNAKTGEEEEFFIPPGYIKAFLSL
jgi:hypothetical protein